jgi:poly-gamma-glutamate capsule biosynthesis protein CapA/YwtB (metallophosphatase superfamily)
MVLFLVLMVPVPAYAERLVLAAVGDIMLAGSSSATLRGKGYVFAFAATAHVLRGADIAVGNLEAPLARHGLEFVGKKFRFKVDPAAAVALRDAGFSVLTLANNHIMDFGAQGLRETLRHLNDNALLAVGAGENLTAARVPAYLHVKGKTVAFLAYSLTQPLEFFATEVSPGTAPGYSRLFQADIKRAKLLADYVVVSFHWGAELARLPKPYQIAAAHKAIDAGADVVLGHHPHVLQGIERYRGGVILYSLGNFAFGSLSRNADVSIMARIVFGQGGSEIEVLPLDVLNKRVGFQPTLLRGDRAREVISRLRDLSRQWSTEFVVKDGRYLVGKDVHGARLVVR